MCAEIGFPVYQAMTLIAAVSFRSVVCFLPGVHGIYLGARDI